MRSSAKLRDRRRSELEAFVAPVVPAKPAVSYLPHEPTPKQREFLALGCLEALYGGAAGGGKTDALLMAAAQYVHEPGYAALILRRTFRELNGEEAILNRAKEWWRPLGVAWHEQDKRFTFPSGATISFGYLDCEADKYQYQSQAFQCIVFDELTEFPSNWYTWMFSRLRRLVGNDVPLRVRSASNPGGIGHDWVKRRFIDESRQAVFIPASLTDNPYIDQAGYRASLDKLDPITRQQLLEGVWVRDGGGLVYRQFIEARNLIPSLPGDEHTPWTRILGIDFGFVDSTAFSILAYRPNDPCVYVERCWKTSHMTPTEVGELVKSLPTRFARIVGDTGGLGKAYSEEMRRRFSIPVEAAEKQNKLGYIDLLNGALASSRLMLVQSATLPLQQEWLELPWHSDKQAESPGFENHCADATLYGWRAASNYHARPVPVAPTVGTPEYYAAQEAEILKRITKSVEAGVRARRADRWWE